MSPSVTARTHIKVADEVWLAVAWLHRQHPERPDFSIEEIMDVVRSQKLSGALRPGVYVHIVQHCVANRPANPARYRMLFESAPGRRRLYRKGDTYHPDRDGGKILPAVEDLPYGYSGLPGWYREWNSNFPQRAVEEDPLLSLRGSGKHLWADEHADEYVRRLREGW
jgi:hypothetical protein